MSETAKKIIRLINREKCSDGNAPVCDLHRDKFEGEIDALLNESEAARLRTAIETHRAQRADDRCWLDDLELYKVLGDEAEPDNRVGDKYQMLANCVRFIDNRCEGGGWRSYIEIERELTEAHNLLTTLGAPSRHYNEVMEPSKLLIPSTRSLTERLKALIGSPVEEGEPVDVTAFDAAVQVAKAEGYPVQSSGAGDYIEWRYTDRERALLTLLRKELFNLRGIRIPIPMLITAKWDTKIQPSR